MIASVSKKMYLPITSARARATVDFPVPIMPTKNTFVPCDKNEKKNAGPEGVLGVLHKMKQYVRPEETLQEVEML